jgi:hypothetical protein
MQAASRVSASVTLVPAQTLARTKRRSRPAGRPDTRVRKPSIVRPSLAMSAMRSPERTHPASRSLLPGTSTRSAAPREALNAVHRNDVRARLVPTNLSSNTVAVAMREGQERPQTSRWNRGTSPRWGMDARMDRPSTRTPLERWRFAPSPPPTPTPHDVYGRPGSGGGGMSSWEGIKRRQVGRCVAESRLIEGSEGRVIEEAPYNSGSVPTKEKKGLRSRWTETESWSGGSLGWARWGSGTFRSASASVVR